MLKTSVFCITEKMYFPDMSLLFNRYLYCETGLIITVIEYITRSTFFIIFLIIFCGKTLTGNSHKGGYFLVLFVFYAIIFHAFYTTY